MPVIIPFNQQIDLQNIYKVLLVMWFCIAHRIVEVLGNFGGTFSDFMQLFREKRLCAGDWFDFNVGWWQERKNPNVFFTTYERMSADLPKTVGQLGEFLGKPLTKDQIDVSLRLRVTCTS